MSSSRVNEMSFEHDWHDSEWDSMSDDLDGIVAISSDLMVGFTHRTVCKFRSRITRK